MMQFVMLLVAGAFVLSPQAAALDASSELTLVKDGFRRMQGHEIERLISGRTVTLMYGREDREVTYFYRFDGSRSSLYDGFRVERQWYVADDRLCEEYLGPNDFVCSTVFEKDGIVQLCPEGEHLCWYELRRFEEGDVNGMLSRALRP